MVKVKVSSPRSSDSASLSQFISLSTILYGLSSHCLTLFCSWEPKRACLAQLRLVALEPITANKSVRREGKRGLAIPRIG